MRIVRHARLKRSSDTSLAKVDNRPGFAAPEPFLKTPGHLLRRCHQISVAIFLDECQVFDLTPLQYVTLSALATHGPLDKATSGGVVALYANEITVVMKNLRSLDTCRPGRPTRTDAPS